MKQMKEVFGVREIDVRGEKKSYWTRVGVCFVNDGGTMSLKLDYVPVGSEINLVIKDKKEGDYKNKGEQNDDIFQDEQI